LYKYALITEQKSASTWEVGKCRQAVEVGDIELDLG
jgi:hypothetical protein